MITDSDRDVVIGIVKEFISKKWEFTAYNITAEARKKGVSARHNDVKQIVHDMYSDGEMDNYVRKNKDVGKTIQPFLYSPPADSVTTDGVDNDGGAQADPLDELDILDEDDDNLVVP
jgi:hypothetical protein